MDVQSTALMSGVRVTISPERVREIAEQLVARYQDEIVDYRQFSRQTIIVDVVPNVVSNIEEVVRQINSSQPQQVDLSDQICRTNARRFHQGISLDALLHAHRIWGHVLLHEFTASSNGTDTLAIASRIMEFVNEYSHHAALIFREENDSKGADPTRLSAARLEQIILGGARLDDTTLLPPVLQRHPADSYVIVLSAAPAGPLAESDVRAIESRIRETSPDALTGTWDNYLVSIVRCTDPAAVHALSETVEAMAASRLGWVLALSAARVGISGIARSYEETSQCLAVALSAGWTDRVTRQADLLLDRILSTGRHSEVLRHVTIEPLERHDHRTGGDLLSTLLHYVSHSFNVTKTARALHVSPNTVTYRLRKIEEILQKDFTRATDLILVSMGAVNYTSRV